MEMSGEQQIPASQEKVWEALNDPELLKKCIPGCDSLEKTSDTEMSATVTAKVGPVKAKFKGEVTLSDLNPPNSYKISGEGKGGVAGFAKGSADVTLSESGDGTLLSYEVNAKVGGKLAQLGNRLIDSTARKMAEEFFSNLNRELGGTPVAGKDEPLEAVELDPGLIEEAKSIANEHAIEGSVEAMADAEHALEDAVKDVEEKVEVAAGKGFLGGPLGWGLMALVVLIALYWLL
ncbi:Carbon monoxide dehydrogenase subunit G (CoxG) [Pseudovibrio sp. Ad13]|uniref:SRPBCC family protein n=1 Tax=Pseudovibrio sp. Ad13 TaxID=989396 RepID=UPI0007AECFA4|nr:carbon monoxide dehydrogenase subunit G [Pseudovibrio sp. Ad13]KZK85988.1 Carbon monoxide dehydrogenase subunit G (CoxG) [Pseudovibrio sp. Ad13]